MKTWKKSLTATVILVLAALMLAPGVAAGEDQDEECLMDWSSAVRNKPVIYTYANAAVSSRVVDEGESVACEGLTNLPETLEDGLGAVEDLDQCSSLIVGGIGQACVYARPSALRSTTGSCAGGLCPNSLSGWGEYGRSLPLTHWAVTVTAEIVLGSDTQWRQCTTHVGEYGCETTSAGRTESCAYGDRIAWVTVTATATTDHQPLQHTKSAECQ